MFNKRFNKNNYGKKRMLFNKAYIQVQSMNCWLLRLLLKRFSAN